METSVQYAMLHFSSQSATSLLLLKSSLLLCSSASTLHTQLIAAMHRAAGCRFKIRRCVVSLTLECCSYLCKIRTFRNTVTRMMHFTLTPIHMYRPTVPPVTCFSHAPSMTNIVRCCNKSSGWSELKARLLVTFCKRGFRVRLVLVQVEIKGHKREKWVHAIDHNHHIHCQPLLKHTKSEEAMPQLAANSLNHKAQPSRPSPDQGPPR